MTYCYASFANKETKIAKVRGHGKGIQLMTYGTEELRKSLPFPQ